jgi:hypothetical protein
MRKALPFLLCLLGAGGVWAWALLAPKEAKLEPLPARFVGTFRFFAYDPPPDGMANPLPQGLAHVFVFRPDGTYLLSVLVSSGYEFLRDEGVVTADEGGVLTMTRISRNREENRAAGERYRAEWGEDAEGRFLALRHVPLGYTFRMRPQKKA